MKNLNLLPFNAWSWERIKDGRKICTSRHRAYRKDPAVWKILPKMEWNEVKRVYCEEEGAQSASELQDVVEGIYNRRVLGNELFFVHAFNPKKVWATRFERGFKEAGGKE